MTEPEDEGPISARLREMIAELDAWLAGEPEDELVGHVLPFATEWVLREVEGLDVDRYREEAKIFILATPLGDRVLLRFPNDVSYWVGQRMLMNEQHEPELERARGVLAAARAQIGAKADLLEQEGYLNVAAGFRRLLDESAGGEPPADLIWSALALRIAEPFLADPVNVIPLVTPSRPASEQREPSPE
jgi:hypothetical protein